MILEGVGGVAGLVAELSAEAPYASPPWPPASLVAQQVPDTLQQVIVIWLAPKPPTLLLDRLRSPQPTDGPLRRNALDWPWRLTTPLMKANFIHHPSPGLPIPDVP